MRRILVLFFTVLLGFSMLTSTALEGAQRVIIAEEFTATWCGYCPDAQWGLHKLKHEVGDSMAIIAYHSSSSDPFYTSEASSRASYYGMGGYPTSYFGGIIEEVGASDSISVYNRYRDAFDSLKTIPSPISMELTGIYDSTESHVWIKAEMINQDTAPVSGKFHTVITEWVIDYSWQTENQLYEVEREMVPGPGGKSISIGPGDTLIVYSDFEMNQSWDSDTCGIITFVQKDDKEIIQGSEILINELSTGNLPPDVSSVSLFDNACTPNTTPELSFTGNDGEGDDIEYKVYWSTDAGFNSPDSTITSLHANGDTASITPGMPLTEGNTYYWKVKGRDPSGSDFWSLPSEVKSFTVDGSLPANSTSWKQSKGPQFETDELLGLKVVVDYLMLSEGIESEGFESGTFPPEDWTILNVGSSSNQWMEAGDYVHSGSHSAKITYDGSATIDSWLVTESIDLSSFSSCSLSFYQRGNWTSYYSYWGVYVSTTSQSDTASFTELAEVGPTAEDTWEEIVLDLTPYCGNDTVYLAFRYNEYNGTDWWIDDISLTSSAGFDEGKVITGPIVYGDLSEGYNRYNAGWGDICFEKLNSADSIGIKVEYLNAGNWFPIPDSVLPGNSDYFYTSSKGDTFPITSVDTSEYDTLRLVGQFYAPFTGKASSNPALISWELGNVSTYAGVEDDMVSRSRFNLFGISPNPVHLNGVISYVIPEKSEIELSVFDISGRKVSTLFNGVQNSGVHRLKWNGKDNDGKRLASGVYFIRLKMSDRVDTEKALIVR